ncbi:MAG: hypothetical protein BZ138_06060 [Methanosphaera sp. rholeuAM270]|nr:MAG: hypothetical protein BZ138_06060 [Methanosphaera sp. rholeuAM270]
MLKRKMLRDIKEYKVQFISIFLMAFIGMIVFMGIYVDTASFEKSIDDYYDESNLADGWIYSDYLVDEFLHQTYALGATVQMERQLVVDSRAQMVNKPDIVLHFVENNTISKFYVLEGKKLDINDAEGVWLDKSFADDRNLKIGDEITFESNGMEIRKKIKGFGYSPEYVYNRPISTVQNYNKTGFAYMSHKAFPSENIPYNVLEVKFTGTPETYSQLLNYRLGGYYTTFLERSNQRSVAAVSEAISQHKSISSIFPSIFIIISMSMLLTTMKRIISHQRTQIGILKANGFKNITINLHYILSGFLLVIAGSILGAIVGPIIMHTLANPSRTFVYKFPYWVSSGFSDSSLIIPVMGAIALLVSYYSIKNIVNEPVSLSIKPKAPGTSTLRSFEKTKTYKNLPFNFRWNFRNIKRNKSRALMTILGIIGCTVLLVSALGLYGQINESKDWYFNDVNHFDSKMMTDKNLESAQINSIAEKVNGDVIMESSIEVMMNKTEVVPLMVLNGTDLITVTDKNRNRMEIADNEVSISQKMADRLNITVGDTIYCHMPFSDKNISIRIDKIHSSPFSQGFVMTPKKLNELGINYTPTSIVTSQHVNESIDGITDIIYLDDMIAGWDEMEETSIIVIAALIFFAIILSVVILYNLNLLSFTEMEQDITTLKVLGFKSNYLTKLLATQSMLFIIVGFVLGIPISYYVLSRVMPSFGRNIYMIPSISVTDLLITFSIIMSVSVAMIIYFSHKIRNLDMVDSLKELER